MKQKIFIIVNKNVAIRCFNQHKNVYGMLCDELKNDIDIVKMAIELNYNNLSIVPDEIKQNEELMSSIVQKEPNAFLYLMPLYKDNVDFLIKNDEALVKFLSHYSIKADYILKLNKKILENKDFVVKAIKARKEIFTQLPSEIKKCEDVFLAFAEKNPLEAYYSEDTTQEQKQLLIDKNIIEIDKIDNIFYLYPENVIQLLKIVYNEIKDSISGDVKYTILSKKVKKLVNDKANNPDSLDMSLTSKDNKFSLIYLQKPNNIPIYFPISEFTDDDIKDLNSFTSRQKTS